MLHGYYTEYSYVGFMPNGEKRWFDSDEEYAEAYYAALENAKDSS